MHVRSTDSLRAILRGAHTRPRAYLTHALVCRSDVIVLSGEHVDMLPHMPTGSLRLATLGVHDMHVSLRSRMHDDCDGYSESSSTRQRRSADSFGHSTSVLSFSQQYGRYQVHVFLCKLHRMQSALSLTPSPDCSKLRESLWHYALPTSVCHHLCSLDQGRAHERGKARALPCAADAGSRQCTSAAAATSWADSPCLAMPGAMRAFC